jgi:glutamate carboxypeptidase
MNNANHDGAALFSYFKENRAEVLQFIRWLVEQESMSREADATARIAENLGERLAVIGASVELFRDPSFGATLLARFETQDPGPSSQPEDQKQLLVVGHLDTVWPRGTLSERPFRIDDGRAYGPGIFDMKSGAAGAVFAIKALKDLGLTSRHRITLLMTCDEETGSHFSRDIVEQEGRNSCAALVLEPPIPGGTIKTGRKGVGEFELIVRGRPSHAGNDPRAGISAVTELAHQILAINALIDYERGTTLNVGVIKGGVLSNVVAAEARARVDMRFQTIDEGERIVSALTSLKPILEGARLEVRGGINRPPLVRTPEIGTLFEHAKQLSAELGFGLEEGTVGGGSDGNFIAALGVPVLDGLGVDGAGAHAEDEHIVIADIPRQGALLARLIQTL